MYIFDYDIQAFLTLQKKQTTQSKKRKHVNILCIYLSTLMPLK